LAAPLAVRAIRATMRAGLVDRVRAAMERELSEQQKLWPTADFAEGVKAVAERRPARFEGR
jgi:enoyl-CoA hydratase/carnithine racemase